MYIPTLRRESHDSVALRRFGSATDGHANGPWTDLPNASGRQASTVLDSGRDVVERLLSVLAKRQFSNNATTNTNIQIAIIVSILLTAFIIGVGIFLYIYRGSIRFRFKRRARRRRSTSSRVKTSGEGDPPPDSGEKSAE